MYKHQKRGSKITIIYRCDYFQVKPKKCIKNVANKNLVM